jgi:hyperosmotically inducible protein
MFWNGTKRAMTIVMFRTSPVNRMQSGRTLFAGVMLLAFAGTKCALAQTPSPSPLEAQVRHELLQLPYYGVFDYLQFSIDGDTVTLTGQASNYVLRNDAIGAVKHLAGVRAVNDQIEVLPLSSFDDRIRLELFRSLYRDSALNRYRLIRVQPSIRIIVNNGNVTLTGIIDSEMDRNIVYDRAMEVRDAFSVTNDLKVQ